jgi:fructokinase
MRKVIGIGETILDILFKEQTPQAALPGGSVFNAFISLGRLGVPLSFVSEIGNDKVGDIILDFMKRNNIPTDYVDRFPDGKSPVSIAFLNQKNDAEYIFYKDYPQQRLEVPLPEINENDIFIYGSYYALNPALRERMTEFLKYAKSRKAILYYDPNFRNSHAHETMQLLPTILENLEYADIVRGSEEDFHNIFGDQSMENVYNNSIKYYCPRLIVTHGGNSPVQLFTATSYSQYLVTQVNPVSTIGAGDNFNAGIIYAIFQNNISHNQLDSLPLQTWDKLMQCGIDLATNICRSSNNYISPEFAASYAKNYIQ